MDALLPDSSDTGKEKVAALFTFVIKLCYSVVQNYRKLVLKIRHQFVLLFANFLLERIMLKKNTPFDFLKSLFWLINVHFINFDGWGFKKTILVEDFVQKESVLLWKLWYIGIDLILWGITDINVFVTKLTIYYT